MIAILNNIGSLFLFPGLLTPKLLGVGVGVDVAYTYTNTYIKMSEN
jgi:hypothetical protein